MLAALTSLAGASSALAAHSRAPAPAAHAATPAHAVSATRAHAPQLPAADSLAGRALVEGRDSIAADRLRLDLAVLEQSRGNTRGLIQNLEALDYSPTPAFPEADRAAFLLGHAYLEAGRRQDYLALAEQVSHWSRPSVYTAWIAYQRLATFSEEAGTPTGARDSSESAATAGAAAATQGGEAATALAASLWLRSGRPDQALALLGGANAPPGASAAVLCMRAAALEQSGADNGAELDALMSADTASALGRDLAGLARIQLATRAMTRGEDARPLLEGVPHGSRYEGRARQMLGLMALEAGERENGERLLQSAVRGDSSGTGWREASMALAGQDLDDARWEAAERRYHEIDSDWTSARDTLQNLLDSGSFDRLWRAWRAEPSLEGALVVDDLPARMLSEELAAASGDLTRRPESEQPSLSLAPGMLAPLASPPAADWESAMTSERMLAELRGALEARRWDLASENERLSERRRYLGMGGKELGAHASRLLAEAAILSSLGTTLDSLDARLRAVRDQERERVALRAAAIREQSERNLLWARGMRRLFLNAPDPRRSLAHPPGYPAPDSVLHREELLARRAESAADTLAARTPGILSRSYLEAWRPGLIDRETAVSLDAVNTLNWARELQKAVDSSVVAAWKSPVQNALELQVAALERSADSLAQQDQALHDRVAREAVQRGLQTLDDEREGIDYGMAAAAYGLSVHLSQADTALNAPAVVQAAGAALGDSASVASGEADDAEDSTSVALRARAIERLRVFLERHPTSASRAEMRFRLADLELIEARRVFREQMAAYMKDGAAHGARLPVLTHAAALDLYRKILAEDHDFPHLDAVLFNAGMILADEGDPEAERFFQQLVTEHATSPYDQEAYLRMGDMQFNDKHFSASVPLYQNAAAGPDPTLAVIALYKMGWAHFNEDRFGDAAEAFGAVLDRYQGADRAAIHVDIEGEARTYLVLSLAGAGGAPAFAKYFDGIGPRPYERALLASLSQHFRRYDQYPQAAETDELFIRRYPQDPDALVAAQRLLETYQRSNRAPLAEQGASSWRRISRPAARGHKRSPATPRAPPARTFARTCWMSLALEHHRARA